MALPWPLCLWRGLGQLSRAAYLAASLHSSLIVPDGLSLPSCLTLKLLGDRQSLISPQRPIFYPTLLPDLSLPKPPLPKALLFPPLYLITAASSHANADNAYLANTKIGTSRPSNAKLHLPADPTPDDPVVKPEAEGGVKNGLVERFCWGSLPMTPGDGGRLDWGEGVVGNSEFLGVGGRASNA